MVKKADVFERFLVPATGLRIVDPANGLPLPEAGTTVRGHELYWLRRLAEGDVVDGRLPSASSGARKQRTSTSAPATSKASEE